MIRLRQSTASQEIPLGVFVDSTDGNTAETGLTIANTDIKIWKTGATTLANKNSGGATHISGGIYYAVLDATDTDTIGPLRIFVHVAGALAVMVACEVLDEAVYDAMFGTVALATATNITAGTITTATNVTTVNGLAANVITAAAIATGAIDADAIADNAIDAGAIAADAITAAKIADGAIDAATFAAGAITATVIATGAIDADALAADAVTEIAAGITIPSAASIADAVWDEDATAHQTQGTFGQAIGDPAADANTIYGAVVTGATGATIAADIITIDDLIDTEVGAIKTKTDSLTFTTANRVDAQVFGMQADTLTASALAADAVTEIAAGGGGGLDAAGVRAAVGLAAANLDTQLDALPTNAELATALAGADDAVLAAIAALNNLSQANVRTALGLAAANLDTQLGDLPTNAELATALAAADDAILAAVAALNNLSAAQVNAEVVDALTVDVIADSTPAHESRPTIAQGVLLATRLLTEKEVAGTTVTVNKEDGTTAALTLTLDDATNPTSITRAT